MVENKLITLISAPEFPVLALVEAFAELLLLEFWLLDSMESVIRYNFH